MKETQKSKILLVLAVVAVLGIGSYAYADWGMGYGGHRGYGWGSGYGPGMMGPGGYGGYGMGPGMMYGYGNEGRLSDEDARKIEKEQAAFFEATEKLRQDAYAKGLELRSELAKEHPDAKRAAGLQRELSGLENQLDQKRLDHEIALRKIAPNVERGFAGRGPAGYGPGYGAPCWQ